MIKCLLVPYAIAKLIFSLVMTLVFMPFYLLLCPYAHNDNLAYVDRMNYLNHFEDLL